MNKLFIALFSLCSSVLLMAQDVLPIIPQPVSVTVNEGTFVIDAETAIVFDQANDGLEEAARFFSSAIEELSGYALPLQDKAQRTIELKLESLPEIGDEGYTINVTPEKVLLRANLRAGIIYGMQSLLQLLPAMRTNAALEIPCLSITDYPRFEWRGMHLDVSRHFFGPEVIKQYIDLMAAYKLNTFHWHLVDDQGWRLEIKKYPKLTDIGAWRVDQTHLVWGDRPQAKADEKPTYGGYYTQEQIREIVAYAAERNITIVPEIEMPGHIASAIAAYPELSCSQIPQLPLTGGNYTNMSSNYCAGNDAVFDFLEDVLREVVDLFPSEYIHVGGDEVNKEAWKHCDRCQRRIKDEKLKDEHELQSYFITRIEKFLNGKGRRMIGWDEILEGGLAPDATVMSWRGEAGGIEAAKMSHDVVMTPGKPLYFDHYQAGPEGEPRAIGGFNTLKHVYDYNPIPEELSSEQAKYVMGAQANVWTEYITTAAHLEYMVLPRMLALAEAVWTPLEDKTWEGFNRRLQSHLRGFEQRGLNYCPGNFTVAITPESANGILKATLGTEILGAKIHYTLDGSDPTLESLLYTQPIIIDKTTELKAVNVVHNEVKGYQPASQHFAVHEAIGREVKYTNPVSRYYTADGPNALTDGVRGTGTVGKYWHGFSGKDLIATIDLGEQQSVRRISLGCLQKYRDWIFMPEAVTFEVSQDGKKYKELATVANPIARDAGEVQHDFTLTKALKNVRYIRVSAKNTLCPEGHPGSGKPAWIFADEIIVE
ncbi:glycoside hydrolase family 20 protein [Robertkochia sediminum]|uniref:glycoside hydrolase family 20 protein n=1 Tax=Robertkochia sediminum TaxID=2785326 RepID=UPI0019326994|nr:glycoside hydrolase family 20 protein [Robertkochia sediminum]MBL7471240.1 family 20 glycosylhydrolase [Robertkochia sediminum]